MIGTLEVVELPKKRKERERQKRVTGGYRRHQDRRRKEKDFVKKDVKDEQEKDFSLIIRKVVGPKD